MSSNNPNQNFGSDERYVNFDQFMTSYNMTSFGNVQPFECNNPSYQNQIQNSNLIPTAAEFVPRNPNSNSQDARVTNAMLSDLNLSDGNNQSSGSSGGAIKKRQSQQRPHQNQNYSRGHNNSNQDFDRNRGRNRWDRNRGGGGGGSDYQDNDYHQDRNVRDNQSRNYNRNGDYNNKWRKSENSTNSQNQNDFPKNGNSGSKKVHPDFKLNRNLKVQKDPFLDKCSQREKQSREIESGKLECLVCCENIKPFQSVWSCSNCYHILHLSCIMKWGVSSRSEDGWRCPACQNNTKTVPKNYYCFCGKQKNPQYNRNDLAHTCGDICEKSESCEHSCTLLCHPGPCPPCQATVTRKCGCGKSSKMMQCNQKDEVKCDLNCEKLLNCELHECSNKCHLGVCENCDKTVDHRCYCGKDHCEVPCNTENNENKNYSCGKICNRNLACKNHRCMSICHAGDCGDCKLSPEFITSCPCGKVPIFEGQRKTCSDSVPLCSGNCGKPLKCGPPGAPHLCSNKCHNGNCAVCTKETAVKCRCGNMDQMVKCRLLFTRADDARCKKRCTKKRNCGKHKCNQECCIDIDHICPLPCTFTLSCGKHKCEQTCHKGRCQPCYRSSFDELHCECGANVIYPPVPCGTKRPSCEKPCTRRHQCNHQVLHNCHSTSLCPPCMIQTAKFCYGKHEQRRTIPCSQEGFSCGMPCNKPSDCKRHKCIKPCHDGPCLTEGEICKQNCTTLRTICGHKCNAPCHEGTCPDIACKENVEVVCQCGNRKQIRTCHDFSNDYRRIATAQLASSMQEMQRGNSVDLCDILGPIKINNNKTLECNDDCKLLERNRRLAIGLQIRNPDLASKIRTNYSDFLKGWAKKDPVLMRNIHDKLTELVKLSKESKQRSRSHSFPTMNREKRQVVHEMCGMFGLDSIAYDAEPNRNVVATAHKDKICWLPAMSLMEVIQRESGQRRIPVPNMNAWGLKK